MALRSSVARGISSVAEAESGYRRGVVMGLTMAEIMLLFVFCLLLVAAGMVADRDAKIMQKEVELASVNLEITALNSPEGPAAQSIVELRRQNDALLQENTRLREVVLPMSAGTQVEPISEQSWRELSVVREIVQTAAERGVPLIEVLDQVGALDPAASTGTASATQPTAPAAEPGHQWPPIITLGSDRYRFQTNSAELTPQFREYLTTVTSPQVQALLDRFQVDVIEVVGHTDESPITATRPSTMDSLAINALKGKTSVGELIPADNAGLGLARAIAVVNALQDTPLGRQGIKMIPLSAAQVVMPGDVVSDGSKPEASSARRRIEIRVRRTMPSE
jgi:outer membrane protein OmpA-like peptidoglycan-associated protein